MDSQRLYPDTLKALSRYERLEWWQRVAEYRHDRCSLEVETRYDQLWRVAVYHRDGRLRRFFYERQAEIVLTLWYGALRKHENKARQAAGKSTKAQSKSTSGRLQSKGKDKGGDQGGNPTRG